jgi:pimeloyl-ACP methyl ester carboxylesterase
VEGWTYYLAEKRAFNGLKTITLTPELLQKRKERRARGEKKWGKERMNAFGKVWRKWDGREFLKSTDLPILEIYGDRGREKPSLDALYIPERPNISVVWVANASHPIPEEKPQELANIIQKYLNSRNER